MLQSLFLRDFVIVDQAEIEFADGFCALSGETGAGKSILLDALGLALGSRADAAAVRAGAKRTEITACFVPSASVREWLEHHDLANEDHAELLMRRLITSDGRSRSFINGTPVKLAQLRALGEQVLEIHGQHASQSLLRTEGQRDLLDSYGALAPSLTILQTSWRSWQSARKTLAEATGYSAEMAAERERVNWQLAEIDELQLRAGEWAELSEEQNRLAHASSLIEAAQNSVEAISEGEQAMHDQLVHIINQMQSGARLDGKLTGPLEMLENARIQLSEAASDLGAYVDGVDVDPARLSIVEQRVSAIFNVARKLGLEPDELTARAEQLRTRLADLERAQDLEKLQAQVDALQADYEIEAANVHAVRNKVAKALATKVNEQLELLGMPAARFGIALLPAGPGPSGTDLIEFQFTAHASMPLRPLAKVASGGELSRISLAIAVCAAQANPVPTLIFDEADAGVGGSVADAIGLLMRRLGESRQVMAVTHLPQVAARAHHHFQVSKQTRKGQVTSAVTAVHEQSRVDEIARMLGGAKVTQTTREHARELLRLGAKDQPRKTPTKQGKSSNPKAMSKGSRSAAAKRKPAKSQS